MTHQAVYLQVNRKQRSQASVVEQYVLWRVGAIFDKRLHPFAWRVEIFKYVKKINILCGHFEGVDQRLLETRNIEEYSIGDFILSGGESASLVFVDALVRLIPGVLGNADSAKEESFENNLLEYPQYTKPREWEGKKVPEVLFSGDHAKIKGWRLSQSEAITRRLRPDFWKKYLQKKK